MRQKESPDPLKLLKIKKNPSVGTYTSDYLAVKGLIKYNFRV